MCTLRAPHTAPRPLTPLPPAARARACAACRRRRAARSLSPSAGGHRLRAPVQGGRGVSGGSGQGPARRLPRLRRDRRDGRQAQRRCDPSRCARGSEAARRDAARSGPLRAASAMATERGVGEDGMGAVVLPRVSPTVRGHLSEAAARAVRGGERARVAADARRRVVRARQAGRTWRPGTRCASVTANAGRSPLSISKLRVSRSFLHLFAPLSIFKLDFQNATQATASCRRTRRSHRPASTTASASSAPPPSRSASSATRPRHARARSFFFFNSCHLCAARDMSLCSLCKRSATLRVRLLAPLCSPRALPSARSPAVPFAPCSQLALSLLARARGAAEDARAFLRAARTWLRGLLPSAFLPALWHGLVAVAACVCISSLWLRLTDSATQTEVERRRH